MGGVVLAFETGIAPSRSVGGVFIDKSFCTKARGKAYLPLSPGETVGYIWNAGLTHVNALNPGALSRRLRAGTQLRRESETRWET